MATKFMVSGEEKSLEMRDANGIDWSADFIGNTSHGMAHDEEGRYIATEEDFNWWENAITAHENMNATISAYKEKFDADEVNQVVQDWIGHDLEDAPALVIEALEQAFGKV